MSMIQKIQLKMSIKKFYKTFGEVLDRVPFTTKLRDFESYGFIIDVQFDVLQILEAYEDCFYEEAYETHKWLNKLYYTLQNLKEKHYD